MKTKGSVRVDIAYLYSKQEENKKGVRGKKKGGDMFLEIYFRDRTVPSVSFGPFALALLIREKTYPFLE
jgi:hypothetical protein